MNDEIQEEIEICMVDLSNEDKHLIEEEKANKEGENNE